MCVPYIHNTEIAWKILRTRLKKKKKKKCCIGKPVNMLDSMKKRRIKKKVTWIYTGCLVTSCHGSLTLTVKDSNSCTNQALNTKPDSICMSMHINPRVLALQAYSGWTQDSAGIFLHRPSDHMIFLQRPSDHMNIPAQTRWPQIDHTQQLIPQSGFERGCTWSDMHEMSNNFLMMKNPNIYW